MNFTTCIYCGKPNIHPERIYRYCTGEECTTKARSYSDPEFDSNTFSENEAELIDYNNELRFALDRANNEIEELTSEIAALKDAIVRKSMETIRYIESEKIVARWDVIRFIVKEHRELEMHLEIMKDNPNDIDLIHRIYQEHMDLYAVGLKRLGIERRGVIGEIVEVDHAIHDSFDPWGTKSVVISIGYYHPESDIWIKKPMTITYENWIARQS